jgi:hypothetical protein
MIILEEIVTLCACVSMSMYAYLHLSLEEDSFKKKIFNIQENAKENRKL